MNRNSERNRDRDTERQGNKETQRNRNREQRQCTRNLENMPFTIVGLISAKVKLSSYSLLENLTLQQRSIADP